MRGVVLVLAALVGAAACSSEEGTAPRVSIGPSLSFPRGVFDNVRKLTLVVYDTADGVDCREDGNVTGPTSRPLATKVLSSQGCADGVKFCGDVSIEQSNDLHVFFADATSGSGERVAVGCSKAVPNQDSIPVDIRMRRFIKAAFCGNGIVEPTEQCEKPEANCNDACQTEEVLLSGGRGAPGGTANGKAEDKKHPFLLWPAASGDPGRFLAFFGDNTPGPQEVTVRVLSDTFATYTKQGNEMANYSFFLPNDDSPSAGFPPKVQVGNQFRPAAVYAAGKYYVVYEDDAGGTRDISLRSLTSGFVAEQAPQGAIGINGVNGQGESGQQLRPSVTLGNNGLLFIAWEGATGMSTDVRVHGRTYNPATRALGPQRDDLGSGVASHGIKVASLDGGGAAAGAMYVATWESGADIKMRLIGSDGAPVGQEQTVNDATHTGAQVHPSVAALPDGRFAIVWADQGTQSGDIFVQRYTIDASGAKAVAGDQRDPVNDVIRIGEQNAPTIASASTVGGSYVAAWIDVASGQVRARFLGGNAGALFNHVDGQETEFQASVISGRARANPSVVVGGAGASYVAIGWEDTKADERAGIRARRFPVGE